MPRQRKGKKREISITVHHGREQPGSGAHSPARRTHWGQDATGATLGAGGHEAHRAPVPVETKTTSPWRKKGNETASGWRQRSLYRVIWEDLFDILSDTWNPRQGRSQCSRLGTPKGQKGCMNQSSEKQAGKEDEAVEARGAELTTGPSSP